MDPRLDGPARKVVCGERQWPFELDCRDDTVSLNYDGTRFRLRLLRWRDKRALARFAGLGEKFLQEEFVRVSLAEPSQMPAAREAIEVLFELARWFNAPDETAPLPFDLRTLTKVTLDLCRATGLTPADFDGRDVQEVEQLWDALREDSVTDREAVPLSQTQPHLSQSHGPHGFGGETSDTTTILIVPDPVVSPDNDSTTAEPLDDATRRATSRSTDFENTNAGDQLSDVRPPAATMLPTRPTTQAQPGRFRVSRNPAVARSSAVLASEFQAGPDKISTPRRMDSTASPRKVPPLPLNEELQVSPAGATMIDHQSSLESSPTISAIPLLPVAAPIVPRNAFPFDPLGRPADGSFASFAQSAPSTTVGRAASKINSRSLLDTLPRVDREMSQAAVEPLPATAASVADDFAEELSRAAAQLGIDMES